LDNVTGKIGYGKLQLIICRHPEFRGGKPVRLCHDCNPAGTRRWENCPGGIFGRSIAFPHAYAKHVIA
jgi:hypothetical protein